MDKKPNPFPQWPRGLSREHAADYIGVSLMMFDRMVAEGLMPKPKRFYGRTIWDRTAVDAAFDVLDGGAPREMSLEEMWNVGNEPSVHPTIERLPGYPDYPLNEEDALRWQEEYKAQWKQGVLSRPMSQSERTVLPMFLPSVQEPMRLSDVRHRFRRSATERLIWRGYVIEIDHEDGGETIQITSVGIDALAELNQSS